MSLKLSSAKWRPFCLSFSMLNMTALDRSMVRIVLSLHCHHTHVTIHGPIAAIYKSSSLLYMPDAKALSIR